MWSIVFLLQRPLQLPLGFEAQPPTAIIRRLGLGLGLGLGLRIRWQCWYLKFCHMLVPEILWLSS